MDLAFLEIIISFLWRNKESTFFGNLFTGTVHLIVIEILTVFLQVLEDWMRSGPIHNHFAQGAFRHVVANGLKVFCWVLIRNGIDFQVFEFWELIIDLLWLSRVTVMQNSNLLSARCWGNMGFFLVNADERDIMDRLIFGL